MEGSAVNLIPVSFNSHWPLIQTWLAQPHVRCWWGDEAEQELRALLDTDPDHAALIEVEGHPVGLVCWQRPSEEELAAAGLTDLPAGLMDIDIMIGEPERLGQGIGSAALRQLLARFAAESTIEWAGLATSADNSRARRAYEKAGFQVFCDFQDPDFGPMTYLLARTSS